MEVTAKASVDEGQVWGGGNKPLNASYGKMMMWFFIVSDALTFTGFLVAYGFSRFKNINSWPIADEVFTHFPFLHGIDAPNVLCSFNDICINILFGYNGFSCRCRASHEQS
jgi:cytochrome c oxidase subunit 3